MPLTVHIGTTKTGSKSIQDFLHMNTEELRKDGVLVPTTLGRPYNFKAVLAVAPYGGNKALASRIPIADEASHLSFQERTTKEFNDEVAEASDCHDVVITAELFHSRILRPESVREFRDRFCRQFDQVRVVAYVRPQLDHVVSLYSTVLRNGYDGTIDDFVLKQAKAPLSPYFDLREFIKRWRGVFGESSMVVRPYKAIDGSLGTVGDFLTILGLDPGDERWTLKKKRNVSIDSRGQALLRILNKDGGLDPGKLKQVVRWVERNHMGKGAYPADMLAKGFQAKFADGNSWVIENYFPDHPEYLEPAWR